MAHPKPIKIFSNVTRGVMFFEGSTITPKVLGIIEASLNPDIADKIIVSRTDKQDNQGRNRRLLSKLEPARVQDVFGNFLTDGGYTTQQVINYINGQANADLATSQDEFNAYVDPTYDISNGAPTGSSTYPFTDLQTAMDTVSAGAKIFVRGVNIQTQPLTADLGKSLTIVGGLSTVVGYGEFDPSTTTNIFQLSCETPVHGAIFEFQDLILQNAGGWAINVNNATEINVVDCTFRNNGWGGEGISLTEAASGSTLGYDSTQAELTAFDALSASGGGAIYLNTGLRINIIDNEINDGDAAVKIYDAGYAQPTPGEFVEGYVNIRDNRISNNLNTGIYFDAKSDPLSGAGAGEDGCRNATVLNNNIRDNGGDGIDLKGGSNNTIGINNIRGNWCAGVEVTSVSNTRVRDIELTNNNRANFYANGDPISGNASFIIRGNFIAENSAFIVEMINSQISNTDDVSTVVKNGIEIFENVGELDDTGAVISIDNCSFINQDYSITNNADLRNINVSIDNCKFLNSAQTNIRNNSEDDQDDFFALPFSNHTTVVNVLDVEVNYTNQTLLLKEGINGSTINTYNVQQLVALEAADGTIRILEKNTNRIQLGSLLHTKVYINGSQATGTAQEVVNQLNGAFTETEPGPSTGISTLVVDFSGTPLSGESTNTTSVSGGYQATSNGENNGAVFASFVSLTEALTGAGEYYTFEVTGVGDFAMGLYDFAEPITSIYNIASAGIQEGTYSYGYQFAHVFGRTPVGPWKTVGKNNSYIALDGWTTGSTEQVFDTAATGYAAWNAGGTIEFKVGIDSNDFIEVAYFNDNLNQYVPITRSSYAAASLSGYGLLIKMGDTNTVFTDLRKHQTDYDAVNALSATNGALNFRWIESPVGQYTFPLFNNEAAANYVDENFLDFFPNITQFTPGSGASDQNIFIDEDPTQNTWYLPESLVYTFSADPFDNTLSAQWVSPYVVWNEITTSLDSTAIPTAFGDQTVNVDEFNVINLQIQPSDTAYTTTVDVLPKGLIYNSSTGFVTGTVGNYPADAVVRTTVTRSNAYGSSTGTLTWRVAHAAVTYTNQTLIGGNWLHGDVGAELDYDALWRYDAYLSAGHKVIWTHDKDLPEPMFGLLNTTGDTAVAQLSDTAVNYYDVLGSGAYDFAGTGKWDLRFRIIGDSIGGSVGKDQLVGWHNNAEITGSTDVNDNATFELVNDSADNYLKLYRNNVLQLSSTNTYPASGVQFHLAAYDNDDWDEVYVPNDFAFVSQAYGSTQPPAGFVDPLLGGSMDTSTLMGNASAEDAATEFSTGLKVNHRYIVPQTWIETNVLPYLSADGVGDNFFFGVPLSGDAAVSTWTTVEDTDFEVSVNLESRASTNQHRSHLRKIGSDSDINVNSDTDAFYNYGIEWDGESLTVIGHQDSSTLQSNYGIASGGTFDRSTTYSGWGALSGVRQRDIDLVAAVNGGAQVNLTTSGLSQVRIPWPTSSTILVGEASNGAGVYGNVASSEYDNGTNSLQHAPNTLAGNGMPTLNAGQTYTFIYHPSMEAGDHVELRTTDGTVYTTGSAAFDYTTNGDPGYTTPYKGFTWSVPQDVPPLNIYYYNSFASSYDAGNGLNFSGSTYTASPSGINLDGPAANQTGTNVMDQYDHGWISLTDQLGAGERLVLDNTFFTDFLAEAVDTNNIFAIGLKGDNWTNTKEVNNAQAATSGEFFKGDSYIVGVCNGSGTSVQWRIINGSTIGNLMGANPAEYPTICAFLEITSDGDNIRLGLGRNGNQGVSQGDESTVTYANWGSYKGQTGDQGYGISSLDVVMSFWTYDGGPIDGAEIDWTNLSEINIPTAPTNATDYDKAVDFSGGNEHLNQVSTSTAVNPLMMGGYSVAVANHSNYLKTVDSGYSFPWLTSVVFKTDRNSSNQHIWNSGEGAGSTDDNIYLRHDASGNLYFGWGRGTSNNECLITSGLTSTDWYSVYVAFKGGRFSASNATASNLANAFNISLASSSNSWAVTHNLGITSNWISTGNRTDRAVTGEFTIGGRGGNRNWHGKVASMVVSTLKRGVLAPDSTEIEKVMTDPVGWVTDYKVGNDYRYPNTTSNYTNFQVGDTQPAQATQVWLMGDGTSDSYANGIRNYIQPADQNWSKLQFNSMVSSDIETVTVTGLS